MDVADHAVSSRVDVAANDAVGLMVLEEHESRYVLVTGPVTTAPAEAIFAKGLGMP